MGNSLTSVTQLSRADIERLIDSANRVASEPNRRLLVGGPLVGLIFFEESTRTRIGFQAAAFRLGGQSLLVSETKYGVGMSSPETLEDTVRAIQSYCDVLCVRHPDAMVVDQLHEVVTRPIINCGNGHDEHPTQALVDLMTIKNVFGRVDGMTIAVLGDLRFARSAHSVVLGLSRFNGITLRAISPPALRLPESYRRAYLASGNAFVQGDDLDLRDVDVVYVTGFPPRNPAGEYSAEVRGRYRITRCVADSLKPDAIILCPLPRIDEIDKRVDEMPRARYFQQSENGLAMRVAVLQWVLA